MEKHTALPWQANGWSIFGNGNHPVAEMIVGGRTEATANARYIVTACNAYPALVEALSEITDRFERLERLYFEMTKQIPDGPNGSVLRARAALALAKEEQ